MANAATSVAAGSSSNWWTITSWTASIPVIEIEGMDVVDAMAKVKKGANDRPVKEVKIEEAKVVG